MEVREVRIIKRSMDQYVQKKNCQKLIVVIYMTSNFNPSKFQNVNYKSKVLASPFLTSQTKQKMH